MKKDSNFAFECQDGSFIHYSNVRSMEIYYLDDIPVMKINGCRILNNKQNKRVAKICDIYLRVNNFKTVVKYEKMSDEEIEHDDYETVVCDR